MSKVFEKMKVIKSLTTLTLGVPDEIGVRHFDEGLDYLRAV